MKNIIQRSKSLVIVKTFDGFSYKPVLSYSKSVASSTLLVIRPSSTNTSDSRIQVAVLEYFQRTWIVDT